MPATAAARDLGAEATSAAPQVAPEGRELFPQDLPKPSFLTELRQQETSAINRK